MYSEIFLDQVELLQVAASILALEHKDDALVIRKGQKQNFGRSEWADLLQKQCGMTLDTRHYTHSEELVREPWAEISNQPERATSYTHSTTPQPLHNDNAWFADPAEINFFYMDKQSVSGGEQLIYPVSRLIDDLQRSDPGLLGDLSKTTVTIRKGTGDFQNVTPIIVFEDGGKIFWNFYRTVKTDPFVNEMCERFFKFLKAQESSTSVYKVHCSSGDCVVMHDQRLLHGRSAFVAQQPRDRILYQSMWRLPRSR